MKDESLPLGATRTLLAGDGAHATARRAMCAAWPHMPTWNLVRDRNRAWSRLSGVELNIVRHLADSLIDTGICIRTRSRNRAGRQTEFRLHRDAEQYVSALVVRPITGPPPRPPKPAQSTKTTRGNPNTH